MSKKVVKAYEKQRAKNIAKAQSASVNQPAEESKEPEPKKEEAESSFSLAGAFKNITAVFGSKEEPEVKKAVVSDCDSALSDNEYERRNRSFEEVHSDELDGGLDASSDEEEAVRRIANVKQKAAWKGANRRAFRQEIDTNIFTIDFSQLKNKAELATGDATICKKCNAVFNKHSVITLGEDGKQLWRCEFCMTSNEVDIDEEEKPKTDATNYILEGAAQVMEKKAGGKKDISVVFCIDQSGSMCVSQPVRGKHNIKNDKRKDMSDLMKFSDGSNQVR